MIDSQKFSPHQAGVSADIQAYFKNLPKGNIYMEEAEFGLRRILPLLETLPKGARVLEVGSGPGILLAEITGRFPHLEICGIEPMSEGFALFDEFIALMKNKRAEVNVFQGGYESFLSDEKWDLIFLINVFEHLPDWRDFLEFVAHSLKQGGRCAVLCPNYGFPYESHFKIPILLNKKLTRVFFYNRIARFEKENNYSGLYESLNFVRLSQVRRAAAEKGLELLVDTGIIYEMIQRLDSDKAFRSRQGWFALPAQILKRLGLLDRLLRVRVAQNILPYIQFTLKSKS